MADKRDKKMKELVEALLDSQGVSYDEWLYQKHMEYLAENSDTVLSAIKKGEEKS